MFCILSDENQDWLAVAACRSSTRDGTRDDTRDDTRVNNIHGNGNDKGDEDRPLAMIPVSTSNASLYPAPDHLDKYGRASAKAGSNPGQAASSKWSGSRA